MGLKQVQKDSTAIGWAFTAVAISLTILRYVVRARLAGGLKLDDLLHGCALVAAIAFMAITHILLQLDFGPGLDYTFYEQLTISGTMIGFVGVLFLIKISFLVMYRSIFRVSKPFRMAWAAVCIFTGLCCITTFVLYFWSCDSPFQTTHPQFCPRVTAQSKSIINVMVVSCVLNSLSSIAVMALPLFMLPKLRVRKSDKIALAAVFFLAMFDVIFDIMRTASTLRADLAMLEPVTAMEPAVAVIVSATAALGPIIRRRSKHGNSSSYATGLKGDSSKIQSESRSGYWTSNRGYKQSTSQSGMEHSYSCVCHRDASHERGLLDAAQSPGIEAAPAVHIAPELVVYRNAVNANTFADQPIERHRQTPQLWPQRSSAPPWNLNGVQRVDDIRVEISPRNEKIG